MAITEAAKAWKVGALASSTGLTVRALHHYDHIGLLNPSRRNTAGHRLYTAADVTRLYRISLLRRLGFPLEQIGHMLDDPNWEMQAAVQRHLGDTQRRAQIAASLCNRLSEMSAQLAQHDHPSPDQLFGTLEEMTMLDSAVHSTTALLVYDDLAAAHEYLVRVFGLTPGELERNADGAVVHGEVRAGDQVIWLHPSGKECRSPRNLGGVTGMTVIGVDDADAHHARSVAAGAIIIAEPVDQAYGVCANTAPGIRRDNCGISTRPWTDRWLVRLRCPLTATERALGKLRPSRQALPVSASSTRLGNVRGGCQDGGRVAKTWGQADGDWFAGPRSSSSRIWDGWCLSQPDEDRRRSR